MTSNRIIELPPLVLSPNNFYLYYNEEGDVISLTNEKLETGNFIEVSEKFVVDFLESKKEIRNFKVKITDTIKLEKKDSEQNKFHNFIVVKEDSKAQVTITISKSKIRFKLNHFEKNYVVNSDIVYGFGIVDKRNLNFLKILFGFTVKELADGADFKYEFDSYKEIIVTSNDFEDYGIIYDEKN